MNSPQDGELRMIRVSPYTEGEYGRRRMARSIVALVSSSAISISAIGSGCEGGRTVAQSSAAPSDAASADSACIPPECPTHDASGSDAGGPPLDAAADATVTTPLDAAADAIFAAPIDASPYCDPAECGSVPMPPGDASACADAATSPACQPGPTSLCGWQYQPCPMSGLADGGGAGDFTCQLVADGGCASASGGGKCLPLTAFRYDESEGCYHYLQPALTLGCFAVPPDSPGFMFPPRTGCLEEVSEGERFLWFLPTAFLPPGVPPSYSPPFYLYAPRLQVCDSRFNADVTTSNGCSN
jgi:hypothetical protein